MTSPVTVLLLSADTSPSSDCFLLILVGYNEPRYQSKMISAYALNLILFIGTYALRDAESESLCSLRCKDNEESRFFHLIVYL